MSEPSGTCHEQVSMDIETGLCMKKSSSLDNLDFLVERPSLRKSTWNISLNK